MHPSTVPFLLAILPSVQVLARDITFPPIHTAFQNTQFPLGLNDHGDPDSIDIVTGSQFLGLTTFANTPYVSCFIDSEAEQQKYDIAILGAPFDTGVTARPGARYGPSGIRRGSSRITPSWSVYTGENHYASWARIVDCGDAPLTFLDNTVALRQLDKAYRVIASRPANASDVSSVPRIIMLGGDHTTTLSALRGTYKHWGPVSVIHFDSHIDTWDPSVLGGGISNYAGVNHGTFLHIAHEEGLIHNTSSTHVGIRAPVMRPHADIRNDIRCGFNIITARDIDRLGVSGIIEQIRDRVGDSNVYVSVDIDVLDPAFAPATGTPEVGGFSTREFLSILDGLSGINIVGGDVVEVAPAYDTRGETTVLAAAEVANSLVGLMVARPVRPDVDED